jgi:predicted AAA+ superfamily ATPase
MMKNRPRLLHAVTWSLQHYPVVALLGPRQCGKTTLARMVAAQQGQVTWFDCEDPADRARLSQARLTLDALRGLVVIDEIQRLPELHEILRVLADRPGTPSTFLILGSAAPDLVRAASETLAGRVRLVELSGFALDEVGGETLETLWLRGGFPLSFLAPDTPISLDWREQFIRTFLERDLPQLGIHIPSETLRRFWNMLAHWHGQIWNGAELARSLGSSEQTARRHLDLLAGAFMVRILPPWHANLAKRQVKAPKIYLRDSGILHALLQIPDRQILLGHPKLGASWEGFVIEQILNITNDREAYFWATHSGAELDLLLQVPGGSLGIEVKWTDAPAVTRSMRQAQTDLKLTRLLVVHAGGHRYFLADGIEALPLDAALEEIRKTTSGSVV